MATMAKNLREKFKQLELEYKAKIKAVHDENTQSMSALQERQEKEILTFSQKQDQEKAEFTKKQILEKLAFETNQIKEKSTFDHEKRAERDRLKEQSTGKLKNTEKFIEEIRFPSNSTLQRRFWGFDKQENGGRNAEAWKELECPVCLNEMKPPTRIWQCSQGHPLCAPCRKNPAITQCPTCRMGFVGRNTALEKIALALFEETNSPLPPEATTPSPSFPQASDFHTEMSQIISSTFNAPISSQLVNNSSLNSPQASQATTPSTFSPASSSMSSYRSPSTSQLSTNSSSISSYRSPATTQLTTNSSSISSSQLTTNSSSISSSQLTTNSSNVSCRSPQVTVVSLFSQTNNSSCGSQPTQETQTARTQQDLAIADSDCLKFSSSGPAATVQASKMGVYRKNRETYNGFPVYEMLGGDWFLLVNNNMDWVVSRERGPYPTSFLVNRKKPTPQYPPFNGWQYVTETGVWREDADLNLNSLE